jgi:hypothetical protein
MIGSGKGAATPEGPGRDPRTRALPQDTVMPKLIRALLILAVLLLAACGSTSKLRTESAAARKQIGDYTRVEVADFAVTATKDTKDDH